MTADAVNNSGEPPKQVRVNMSLPTENHLKGYAALSFLYFHSPRHAALTVHDMAMQIMPPLALGAFHIFYEDHMPRAAVTWAMLGDDTAQKLCRGEQLAPSEWASGDQLWIMESLSPFKDNGGEAIARWVVDVLARNVQEFHYLRPDAKGQFTRHITTYRSGTRWKNAIKPMRHKELET